MQTTTQNNLEGLWIDIEILRDTNLSLQEKFVLAIIKALDKNNGCFASNKYFADVLQVTPKRASDIIQSLITKKYITSVVEDNYKRTIRMVVEKASSVEVEEEDQVQEPATIPPKKKPIMWQGHDLSTWASDAIERIKRHFPEVRELFKGQETDYHTNYNEVSTEWQGIKQLQFV